MNRAQRRAGGWDKLNPRLPYDEFVAEVGDEARKVMMVLLRTLSSNDAPFDDRTLWDGVRGLINLGLLNVYFRFGPDGVEVKPEFLMPSDNDNGKRGAA